jgi:hypothetical protein
MKTCGDGDIAACILNLALDRYEWSGSRPGGCTPREGSPDIHWIGGWVSSRAGLGAVSEGKFPAPGENRTPVFRPIP